MRSGRKLRVIPNRSADELNSMLTVKGANPDFDGKVMDGLLMEHSTHTDCIKADFKTYIRIEYGCLLLVTMIHKCKQLVLLNEDRDVVKKATLKDSKGKTYRLHEDMTAPGVFISFDADAPTGTELDEVFTYELSLEIPELKSEFTSEVKFTLKDKSVSLHYEFVGLKGLVDKMDAEEQAHYDGF